MEIGVTQQIQQYVPATDTFNVYTFTSADFDLKRGEAYFIRVNADVDWVPEHY